LRPRLQHWGSDRDRFDRTACLVRSSSPLSPTTHFLADRDFPALGKLRRIGGIAGVGHVFAMVSLVFRSRFGAFVSGGKIPFPGNRDVGSKRRGSTVWLLSRKSEQLMLAGPFCRQVGKASHSHGEAHLRRHGCRSRARWHADPDDAPWKRVRAAHRARRLVRPYSGD
jgi:hypothetical protein